MPAFDPSLPVPIASLSPIASGFVRFNVFCRCAATNLSDAHVVEVLPCGAPPPLSATLSTDSSQLFDTLDSGEDHVRSVAFLQSRVRGLESFRDAIVAVLDVLRSALDVIAAPGSSVAQDPAAVRQRFHDLIGMVAKLEASRMQVSCDQLSDCVDSVHTFS